MIKDRIYSSRPGEDALREIDQNQPKMGVCKTCKTKTGVINYEMGDFRAWCQKCNKHTKPFPKAFLAVKAWNGGQISHKI